MRALACLVGIVAIGCGSSTTVNVYQNTDAVAASDAIAETTVVEAGTALESSAGDAVDAPLPPLPNVSGTFAVACLPTLVGDNPELALMFYGELLYKADASGGGWLNVTLTPLKESAATLSKSETSGTAASATVVAVAADGTFTASFGTMSIPGDAQRIGESTLKLEPVRIAGRLASADRVCGELGGKMVSPIPTDLEPTGDICLFRRLGDGAALPTFVPSGKSSPAVGFAAADYHCP